MMLSLLATPDGIESQIVVTQRAFAAMTQMDVQPCGEAVEFGEACRSTLRYSGDCEGSLVLECSLPVALEFAGRFMAMEAPARFDEDVQDAMGELINTVGGNLKGLLPPDTVTASPVATCSRGPLRGASLSCVDFRCEFGPIRVSLYAEAA